MVTWIWVNIGSGNGLFLTALTHWGRVTHICVSKLTFIGSDNGLSPDRHQAIIWTNAGLLLIGPLGTNFSEILIEILTFSFKKMHLKVSSAKRWPFCLGLNVSNHYLTHCWLIKKVFWGMHLRAVSEKVPMNLICKKCLGYYTSKLLPHPLLANELWSPWTVAAYGIIII